MADNVPESSLTFKTIEELIEMLGGSKFKIPSYQRGYRWKKEEVRALLDDIKEASKKKEFYCLQPVVVKSLDSECWEVIDGQQRLTTIYLILKHLQVTAFDLEYNTRSETTEMLRNPSAEKSNESIDAFHIRQAYSTIKSFFNESNVLKSEWKDTFLKKTRVIWYEPEELTGKQGDVASIEIFSRLNTGKIPLTNSELIRALFIWKSKGLLPAELNEYKIASEWDFIEQQLHNEDFWCWVTQGHPFNRKEYPNRIELLFDLIEERWCDSAKARNRYSTFTMYSRWLEPATEREDKLPLDIPHLWQEVKNYYYRLHEWFIDDSLFHLIGFLRTTDKIQLKRLFELADEKRQSELTGLLREEINGQAVLDELEQLEYGNVKVKETLLLHNIATCEIRKQRFPFRRYVAPEWDIEHVHARADNVPKESRKTFIEQWKEYVDNKYAEKDGYEEKSRKFRAAIEKYDDLSQNNEENRDGIFAEVLDALNDLENIKNPISNLVLLDQGTNRSYKDSPFPYKRDEILRREREDGIFILPCTKDVFTKCYTASGNGQFDVSFNLWEQADRDSYLASMKNTLEGYLLKTEVSK